MAKDLRFQKIQTAIQKDTIAITQVTSGLVRLNDKKSYLLKTSENQSSLSLNPVLKQ